MSSPVLSIACSRPSKFKKSLESIILSGFKKIYISIDYPSDPSKVSLHNECVYIANSCRELASDLDVFVSISKVNLGLRKNVSASIDSAFSYFNSDFLVIVEDDVIVSSAFRHFMTIANHAYSSRHDINHVCGMNHYADNVLDSPKSSTRLHFSFFHLCWGWGTWRSKWNSSFLDAYVSRSWFDIFSGLISRSGLPLYACFFHSIPVFRATRNQIKSWAYVWGYHSMRLGAKAVLPPFSLCTNIGFDSSATNTTKSCYKIIPSSNDILSLRKSIVQNFSFDCATSVNSYSSVDLWESHVRYTVWRRFLRLFANIYQCVNINH